MWENVKGKKELRNSPNHDRQAWNGPPHEFYSRRGTSWRPLSHNQRQTPIEGCDCKRDFGRGTWPSTSHWRAWSKREPGGDPSSWNSHSRAPSRGWISLRCCRCPCMDHRGWWVGPLPGTRRPWIFFPSLNSSWNFLVLENRSRGEQINNKYVSTWWSCMMHTFGLWVIWASRHSNCRLSEAVRTQKLFWST